MAKARATAAFLFLTCLVVLAASHNSNNFLPPTIFSSNSSASSVAIADVNGDGKPDIIETIYCGQQTGCTNDAVVIFLGDGNGNFHQADEYPSGGSGATFVAIADLNGDGKLDLVVSNCAGGATGCGSDGASAGSVGVLLGNGDGTFRPAVTYSTGAYNSSSVAIADVNGDGHPDLLVASQCADSACNSTGSVAVLLNHGDGSFQAAVNYKSGAPGTSSVAVADVNGDGHPDILLANQCPDALCSAGVSVLLGTAKGTFQPAVNYPTGGGITDSIALADVDGNGTVDIVVTNQCSQGLVCNTTGDHGSVSVLLGNGNGTFQTPVSYLTNGALTKSLVIKDLNGDGIPDLAVINTCANATCAPTPSGPLDIFWGNGDGTFQPPVSFATGNSGGVFADVAAADLTGGGRPDLVVVDGPPGASVLLNNYTRVALTSSANPASLNENVTLTATVTGSSNITPTGTVTFNRGTIVNATVPLDSTGTAIYQRAFYAPGTKPLTAAYSGDAHYPPNVSPVLLEGVAGKASSTTLTAQPNPAAIGQLVNFTATVSSAFGSPTGTVSLERNGISVGVAPLNNGKAVFSYVYGVSGDKPMNAVYYGDANFAPSHSILLNEIINGGSGIPTAILLTSSQNPSTVGQTITFVAAVSSTQGTPTGTVTFKMNGLQIIGTAQLTNGEASTQFTFTAPGTNYMTAVYSGDATFQPSLDALDQMVQAPAASEVP